MGYQALLFCPDEKTARTVTQVLSELDFEVVPCTEPFAAVKKLMGEHFDAVVVDCDNEQNATLLFKSARNSPNNQSALAVAVVEGQAGVAKAFRIGANLVLTKPINVEQAKGTLRVARGLLRKNEGAKPSATIATPKPANSAPASAKPTLVPSPAVPRAASIVNPVPATSAQKATPEPSFAASASSVIAPSGESKESVGAVPQQTKSPSIASIAASEAKPKVPSAKKESPLSINGASPVSSAGAASAAAPAREVASIASPEKPSTLEPEVDASTGKASALVESSSSSEAVSSAPSFTFGGAVESSTKSAGGGSKKALLALAAIVLIAAAVYVGWTQLSHPNGTANISGQVSAKPAPPAVSQVTPSTPSIAPASDPSVASSAIPASPTAIRSSASVKPSATAQLNPDASNAKDHKASAVEPSKSAVAIVAENKAPATTAPQPIVVKTNTAVSTSGKSSLTEAPVPSINAIASTSGGTLPNLLGNPNSSPAPVLQTLNVSQGVSQGLAIKKTPPSYPANALRMGIEGSVQLMATISKKGDISAVKVLSGDPNLARAATDAVKQWKYKPYLLDGVPVEIQTQVTVNFKLPR
ncbi:MAG: TonB family protein [Candidatus Sulfotelmatobacter sp.]|jgi:TonB family protein